MKQSHIQASVAFPDSVRSEIVEGDATSEGTQPETVDAVLRSRTDMIPGRRSPVLNPDL
ncbi:hypothetical protein [Streptomyces sp. NPDC002403]